MPRSAVRETEPVPAPQSTLVEFQVAVYRVSVDVQVLLAGEVNKAGVTPVL